MVVRKIMAYKFDKTLRPASSTKNPILVFAPRVGGKPKFRGGIAGAEEAEAAVPMVPAISLSMIKD